MVDELSGGLATVQLSCTVVETGECISEMAYAGSDPRTRVNLFRRIRRIFAALNM